MAKQQNTRSRNQTTASNRTNTKRRQPRKDSESKRVNFDNTRETKFEQDAQEERHSRKGYNKPMRGSKFSKSCSNDVSWYAHSKELLNSAASIPFTTVVGDQLPSKTYSYPGIMTIRWIPNIDGNAINAAANSHYSFTVHANSRNYSYDAPDQMMMIIAGANVFSAIAAGLRAYGVMRNWNGLDRYTPEALISAMGFSYSDLKANLANMWFGLNEIISRSAQIWIPKDMPVIERWFWMNSHIYKDANSSKSQYYMYVQHVYLQFSETGSTTGSSLGTVLMPSDCTWSQYLSFVNGLITTLINSQDRGIIFGDLLAAYGADRIYGISGVDSNYTVTPVYDAEVLTQFENSVVNSNCVINAVKQTSNGVIYTDWAPVQTTDLVPALFQTVLNFHQKEAPTPEQIMVATRMIALGNKVTSTSSDGPGIAPATAGTEIAVRRFMYSWNNSNTSSPSLALMSTPTIIPTTTVNSFQYWLNLCAFDWHPGVVSASALVTKETLVPTTIGSIGSSDPGGLAMDIDMFTFIDRFTLEKMHTTALYSEFGVPTLL